jgi:hypothetical protein
MVRALGSAALVAIVMAACGRIRKEAPRAEAPHQGGTAGLVTGSAGEGGEGNHTGSAGTSGSASGGTAGRAGTPGTSGSAGVQSSGGRASTAGVGGTVNRMAGAGGDVAGAGGTAGVGAIAGAAGTLQRPSPVAIVPVWNGPLPTDCERTYEQEAEDHCTVNMECGNGPMVIYCWGAAGDVAQCQCEANGGTIQPLALDGHPGLGTCRAVAALCSSGEPIDLGGDEACLTLAASTGASSCDLHESCTNTLMSGNVPVRFGRERSIACIGTPESTVLCGCGSEPVWFELESAEPSTTCEREIERCDAPSSTDPDVPPACVLGLQSTFDDYCHADAKCVHETNGGDGATTFYEENRDVLCRGGADPGSTCTCATGSQVVTFRRGALVGSIDDCNGYVERCAISDFELDGPATCDEVDGNATANHCYSLLSCSQAADLAGEAVTVLGRLNARCDLVDGSWSCDCVSNTRRITVDVPAADAEAACIAARTACPQAVPLPEWAGP